MAISVSGSGGLNINELNNTIYKSIETHENKLRTTLNQIQNKSDGAVSQADLLMMQQEVQQWSMMIELQSTITKQISDSLKSVIQKAT